MPTQATQATHSVFPHANCQAVAAHKWLFFCALMEQLDTAGAIVYTAVDGECCWVYFGRQP